MRKYPVCRIDRYPGDTGVARKRIEDLDGYARELERRVKASHDRIRPFVASYE